LAKFIADVLYHILLKFAIKKRKKNTQKTS